MCRYRSFKVHSFSTQTPLAAIWKVLSSHIDSLWSGTFHFLLGDPQVKNRFNASAVCLFGFFVLFYWSLIFINCYVVLDIFKNYLEAMNILATMSIASKQREKTALHDWDCPSVCWRNGDVQLHSVFQRDALQKNGTRPLFSMECYEIKSIWTRNEWRSL